MKGMSGDNENQSGYSPKRTIRSGIHDLFQAVLLNKVEIVKELLNKSSIDLNTTVCGSTVLALALYKGHDEIFDLILTQKCLMPDRINLDKLSKDDKHRLEPVLVTASRLGNFKALKQLISFGADLEAVDNFFHTAVWMATRQRFPYIVAYLLDCGASVDPSHERSFSPLYFSVRYSSGRKKIAELLLYHGASIYIRNVTTSILFCSILEGNIDVAVLLVEAGYNVSYDTEIKGHIESGMLTRNSRLVHWLKQESSNPPTLLRQCRTSIRTQVTECNRGKYFHQKLKSLPLPRRLLVYLALDYPSL